jgi:hypothetical protein
MAVGSVDSSAADWQAGALAAAEAYAIENDPVANNKIDDPPPSDSGHAADGVDAGPTAAQRAYEAFWGGDPNRPNPSTGPGATPNSPGGGPTPVELTPAEAQAIQAAGSSVIPVGNGRYVIDQGIEPIQITVPAEPPSIVIFPDHTTAPSPGPSPGPSPPPSEPTAPPSDPMTTVGGPKDPDPVSPSTLEKIKEALARGDRATALKLAAEGTKAEGRVAIDAGLAGKDPPLLGHTDINGRVTISPEAFDNPALLRSVIVHEAQHVNQIAEGNFHASGDRDNPAALVNELEALRAGIDEAKQYPDDLLTQAQRAVWEDRAAAVVKQLEDTPYHDRVSKSPPDYSLDKNDRCPQSVCYVN